MKLQFGQKVTVAAKLHRFSKRTESGHGRYFYWKELEITCSGIFLGTRTLRNGAAYHEGDEGDTFECSETVQAAIVCPGPRENSFYVPLDAIGPEKEDKDEN